MEALKNPAPVEIELKGDNDNGGDAVDLVTKALDELKGSFDAKLVEIEKKSFGRLDKIEARLNRPIAGNDDKPAGDVERKAFGVYLRRGEERMGAEERKALTVSSDASAGYLAPEAFGNEILKKLVEFSPIRQYARVVSISSPEIKVPRRTSGMTGYWVAEAAARAASEPGYEQVTFTPYELAAFCEVSKTLLEDNVYNLEGELSSEFAEGFGKVEGLAFVKGTGVGQPKGIMTASGITEVKTGDAATLGTNPADMLIGMYHALPALYADRGVWLMNRTTLGTLRTLKDSTGRYLLTDPLSAGAPTTILGRPVVEAVDMDGVAANAYPIMFGDMSGYRIFDRVGISILPDPYSKSINGLTVFHARKRVGGDVTNPDRFVKLKVAA